MKLRRQLPIYSGVRLTNLVSGALSAIGARKPRRDDLRTHLQTRFQADETVLTDSGTSALVLSLRLTAAERDAVALPSFGCIDLVGAALAAGVRVRLYDVDPVTLSPDLDSLRSCCARGVKSIVVAHLFAYPADVVAVMAIAREFGIPVIEDAAQGTGATVHERPAGTFGDFVVLSFGRGKGITCGSGGALLARGDVWPEVLRPAAELLAEPTRGVMPVVSLAAQWVLGRPTLYAIPSAIPGLHLGEMVYRPAREPRVLSDSAVTILLDEWSRVGEEVRRRRAIGSRFTAAAMRAPSVRAIRPVSGGTAGYLRMAVRDTGARRADPSLGILRPYRRALCDLPEMWPIIMPRERRQPGGDELARSLFTLPTHSRVSEHDLEACERWIEEPPLRVVHPAVALKSAWETKAGAR